MDMNWDFPYASRRMPVMASNAVATSEPLAAQAGLRMLLEGGNAADAAIAAAIALTVVEPTSNGLGSDAFMLLWDGQELHGLNASGCSPQAWTPEHFSAYNAMPGKGWDTVTVPGAVSGWAAVSEKFGKLPFEKLFAPAIEYAWGGFPVGPVTANGWARTPEMYADFPEFADAFLPGGQAPRAGEWFACPAQADSLQAIAESRGHAFYQGDLARQITEHAAATGGLMTMDDLAAHTCEWVEPISIDYRGYQLHEIPPNGQGIAALIMLGILGNHTMADLPVDSADSLHLQIEAMKLAFRDANRYVADPRFMDIDPAALLDPDYLSQRAEGIDMTQAADPGHGLPPQQGTVYLTAADAEGMMVSFIQSNFGGFGSGIVIPGTGIAMQNRGKGFTLEAGHPNQVGGGKRPFHTIIPAFVMKDAMPVMSYGVMGGHMQPQGHSQVMIRMCDYGQNPQAALDAPRWQVIEGLEVLVEEGIDLEVREELSKRGHVLKTAGPGSFGGGQAICCLPGGGYCAASEPRKDGQAVGY